MMQGQSYKRGSHANPLWSCLSICCPQDILFPHLPHSPASVFSSWKLLCLRYRLLSDSFSVHGDGSQPRRLTLSGDMNLADQTLAVNGGREAPYIKINYIASAPSGIIVEWKTVTGVLNCGLQLKFSECTMLKIILKEDRFSRCWALKGFTLALKAEYTTRQQEQVCVSLTRPLPQLLQLL